MQLTVHIDLLETRRFGLGRRLGQQLLIDARFAGLVRTRALAPYPARERDRGQNRRFWRKETIEAYLGR